MKTRGNRLSAVLALWALLISASGRATAQQQVVNLQVEKQDQLRAQALNYYRIGWSEFGRGNIAFAMQNYLESKRLFEEAHARRDLIYVLADLGTLSIYSSKYKEAQDYSERSLALAEQLKGSTEAPGVWPDEYGVGTALSNLGNISRRDAEYEKAVGYFQKSLAAYERIDSGTGKYTVDILDDLADIGRTYGAAGDYLRALSYLDKAMTLAKVTHPDREASVSNSLGILYLNQRDYSKAIEFFQRGLKLAVDVRDRFKQADMLLNIGVAYQFRQDYANALTNFERALELAKQINYSELIIPIHEGIGTVYKEQGRYKESLDALDQGLAIAKEAEDKTRIAELLLREAELQLAAGNTEKSIQNASEAIKLAEKFSLRNVCYLALTTLGKAYRAEGQKDLAIQTFTRATSQIEEMRNQVAGLENQRQLFFEDKVSPYQEIVDLFVAAKRPDSNKQALLTAERAKGRVLLDVLGAGRIDLMTVMSEREKEEDRRLNKGIVDLNIQISQENERKNSNDALSKTLNQQLRSARIQYETFQNSLYADHPQLKTAWSDKREPSWPEIASLADEGNTAFLEYVVMTSKIYLFVLTNDSGNESPTLGAYEIGITEKDVRKRTRDFREMITGQRPFAESARELYDSLLKPAEDQLKGKSRLCVIPDGILWDLPFQALEPKDGHYLLEDYAISYAPSLSVLKEMATRKKTDRPLGASLLAFGNPTLPREVAANMKAVYRGESLGPLPDAEMEVAALRDIWGASSSRVFIGPSADKKMFLAEASRYSIIHFATHGILDDSSPMYSRLVMARSEKDPNDDGLLEAREIMQLNLHADLVVLSACQTARGRYGAGEGMVGMSWAFFVAGVPTMVASQWKVDSASTAALMINFHRRLKETSNKNLSKADALRQASLGIMKDPRYRHPFYWAGFVMIGNGM